jgi:hypothetical protein
VLVVAAGASSAAAQPAAPWTSVGSAGTVDEADLPMVQLGTPVSGAVSIRPVLRGAARIRYNVVAVGGILEDALALRARYLDGNDGQRVFLELKEYNLSTGVTTTLLTLDSDDFPPSPTFQVQSVGDSCHPPFTTLNFGDNAYFVDAVLSRFFPRPGDVEPPLPFAALVEPEPASAGPALAQVRIDKGTCIR